MIIISLSAASLALVAFGGQALSFTFVPAQTRQAHVIQQSSARLSVPTALSVSADAEVEVHELDMENSLTLTPIQSLHGTVTLPGSKSLSNRVLLLAALSHGEPTLVENLLESDDIRYMLEALDQMNVPVARDANDATTVTVTGQAGAINNPSSSDDVCELFLGNAGTAMRPLTAALCMGKGKFVLDGVPRMRERPIGDLVDGLQQLGADITCVEETGCPPVTINAGGLKGGKVRMCMDFVFVSLHDYRHVFRVILLPLI
jgi:hypothetical protein